MAQWTENSIIQKMRGLLPGGELLNDDCGVLPVESRQKIVVSTDSMQEETHFSLDWHPPHLLARKLLKINLSDVDASGGTPYAFTFNFGLPPHLEETWIDTFLRSLGDCAREHSVKVIGGDTFGSPRGLHLTATVFGYADRYLTRLGIEVGDNIYVDGPPGLSDQGLSALRAGERWDLESTSSALLQHLDPKVNIGLGVALAKIPQVHVCMDVSDGLSKDLGILAEMNQKTIRLVRSFSDSELHGGEDYLRLFASSLSLEELNQRFPFPFQKIAQVEALQGSFLVDSLGAKVENYTFNHFQK